MRHEPSPASNGETLKGGRKTRAAGAGSLWAKGVQASTLGSPKRRACSPRRERLLSCDKGIDWRKQKKLRIAHANPKEILMDEHMQRVPDPRDAQNVDLDAINNAFHYALYAVFRLADPLPADADARRHAAVACGHVATVEFRRSVKPHTRPNGL